MNERRESRDEGVNALRTRMDADARFRRVVSGYDPSEVRAYVEQVKRVLAQQTIAAKQEQESLIFEMNSAKSEIQARNYAITTLKETLAQQEAQLTAANSQIGALVQSVRSLKETIAERDAQLASANLRITTLVQSVKAGAADREELIRIREAAEKARAAAERVQLLEKEAQQLRGALSQAGKKMETWKTERARYMDDNTRLRQELDYLQNMPVVPTQAPDFGWNNPGQTAYVRQAQPMQPVQSFQQVQQEPPQSENKQELFSQIIDKLADTFAEAYALINQLRASGEPSRDAAPQRTNPPRMQVLRPEGSYMDYIGSKK